MIEKAYNEALKVLGRCVDATGMKASGMSEGYPQIWARDSMITLLGASQTDEKNIKDLFRVSLETLSKYQSKLGYIPINVDIETKKADTTNYGGIDSNLWYIIGHSVYYKRYGDLDFLKLHSAAIEKAMIWLEYQDSNNCGLLEMQEAADWGDLLANRGNALYCNTLYYKALMVYAEMLSTLGCDASEEYVKKAQEVNEKINLLLWPGDTERKIGLIKEKDYCQEWLKIVRMSSELLCNGKYYLPYASFRDFGFHCDALGNSLAIIFGLSDDEKSNKIIDYFIQTGMNKPYPIIVNYPPINPGEKDWREYYRNYSLNLPYQYHNGGIWPFVGGFYVAALVKAGKIKFAEEELENLALANYKGKGFEWEFNEWLNGRSGMPSGMQYQAWSAGMYIFAYNCVRKKQVDM